MLLKTKFIINIYMIVRIVLNNCEVWSCAMQAKQILLQWGNFSNKSKYSGLLWKQRKSKGTQLTKKGNDNSGKQYTSAFTEKTVVLPVLYLPYLSGSVYWCPVSSRHVRFLEANSLHQIFCNKKRDICVKWNVQWGR